jgi:hypothetical protein
MHRKPGTTPPLPPLPLLVLVAALALALAAGCARGTVAGAEEASHQAAVAVEPVSGTGLSRVILSRQAAGRLGIHTATVGEARVGPPTAGGPTTRTTRKVIPYAAVLYDEHGDTWAFTVPAPLTYLRAAIDVDYVEGDLAVLRSGPPAGTTIVTVGAEELLGAELGVGGE